MIDLKSADKLMDGLQYLGGPASQNLFEHLVMAIRGLVDDGDEIALPSWTEPFAWRRTYKVYRILQQRQANKVPEAPDAMASAFVASWTNYIQHRLEFLAVARKDELTEDDFRYLGLIPGDLDSPTVDNADEVARYGIARNPNWMERAARIETALSKWGSLSAAQKAAIPQIMLARRAVARTAELEKRLVELESRSISNQGVSNV